jgi:hypothetical protein
MAKALLGHIGVPNPRMAAELYRLRQRVCDLEAELARLKEEHDAEAGPAARAQEPARSPRVPAARR